MYEMLLKAQHDCPYTELTKSQPRVKFTHWCNLSTDILEIDCPDIQSFETVQKDLVKLCKTHNTRIIGRSAVEGTVQVVAKTCACSHIGPSISELIEKNGCVPVHPTVYTGGWEHHRVIGFEDADLRSLLRSIDKIGKAEVVYKKQIAENSIRQNFTVSLSSLLGGLTRKQTEALFTALQNGYYAIPKQVTAEQLAKRHRVPRTTFEEHVRKAESKVLHALLPFMMMQTRASWGPIVKAGSLAGVP